MDLVAEVRPAGTTVLVATRELADLANRFDWVILLNGRLIAQGPPPVVLTAEQLEAAYGPERVLLRVPAVSLAIDDGADR